MNLLLLIDFSLGLMLTGLIWTIQLVHYPSFHFVDESKFTEFNSFHQRRISYLVMPLMIGELLVELVLTFQNETGAILQLSLTILIWLSTFLFSVPLHQKLLKRYDFQTIRLLVITNWPRTILWSVKSIFVLSLYKW